MPQGQSSHQPASLAEHRSSISSTIASLPHSATVDEAEDVLGPMIDRILSSWGEFGSEDSGPSGTSVDADEHVTALMVCCDKSQLGALKYLEKRLCAGSPATTRSISALVGHPMWSSSEQCGGNSASHHAASSQFALGIDILVAILRRLHATADEELDDDDSQADRTTAGLSLYPTVPDDLSYRGYYLILLSQRNSHGDTPIMMASASGNESVIQHWIRQLRPHNDTDTEFSPSSSRIRNPTCSDIRRAFELKNDAGDTALSIACGHGFYTIVNVLINPHGTSDQDEIKLHMDSADEDGGIVTLSYDDVERCRSVMARIDSVRSVMQKRGGQELKDFDSRRKSIRRCLDMLQGAYEVLAQRSMKELLAGESAKDKDVNKSTSGIVKKRQSRRNGKRGKAAKGGKMSSSEVSLQASTSIVEGQNSNGNTKQDNVWKLNEKSRPQKLTESCSDAMPLTSPRVLTLEDGTVVSTNDELSQANEVGELPVTTKVGHEEVTEERRSMNEMLLERCAVKKVSVSASGRDTTGGESHSSPELEAVMNSLCLDASMLLLSSHGMAMQLSPCQLDAVENLLQVQLGAIKEAKQIQSRVLSRSKQT